MRSITKRALSLMLALMLCVGLLSGISFPASAATVEYVYGTPTEISEYTNVIYNWGTRGEVATFLSPNAEAFYAENNVAYSDLSKLSGSSTSAVYTSDLYIALKALVTDNQTVVTTYDDTRYLYRFTDCQGSALTDDSISCFYSGVSIGPSWDSGSTWNREHTWPNSKGDDNGNGENDIMMLRPTSTTINSSRGNKAYGTETTTQYYNPNNEAGGQYDLRGDVARILLYVYTRWPDNQTTDYMWGSGGVIESKEVLLSWMEADPVDTWEMGRNDSVESITGTRNVYVDYPELAFLLFNEEVPANMTTPSAGEDVVVTPPSYTVTAVSNNVSYGTVSLNENTITATPAANCYVDGYTVTVGTATVVQSGNVFTVTPSSDCTVQINFAANPVVPEPTVAPETPVDGVQVMAHNVYFDDYLQIMYAIYVPEGETIDKIVLSDGTSEFRAVLFDDGKADPVINGKTCVRYVAANGVALQNMDTMVTASIYVDGAVAATDEYSIMQYLHKRLIVGNPTENQRAMYEKLLNLAEKMQTALPGYEVTVHNTSYVQVVNGTVDGKAEAMVNVGAALENVNPSIVPGENQKIVWTVTAYTDTGVASAPEVKTTDEVRAMVVQNGVNLVLSAAVQEDVVATKQVWQLVTDASTLAAGDQIIVVCPNDSKGNSVAMSTKQNTSNRGSVAVTITDNIIEEIGADVQIITLSWTGSYWELMVGEQYLYAASTSSNHLKTRDDNTDNKGLWTITIADGIATIKANQSTRNWLRCNYNSGTQLFSCYTSGQQDVAIYKLVEVPVE